MEGIQLNDFPAEILIKIFRNLNRPQLLKARCINKNFRNIANEVLPEKYSGKTDLDWYQITENCSQKNAERYQTFLRNYGSIVTALQITSGMKVPITKKNWLISLLKENLKNVSKLKITGKHQKIELNLTDILSTFPKVTSLCLSKLNIINSSWASHQYPLLKRIQINYVVGLEEHILKRFLSNNPQLQHFKSNGILLRIDTFDMSSLKSLIVEYDRWFPQFTEGFINENSMARMENLVELVIPCSAKLLCSVFSDGLKNIEKLTMSNSTVSSINNDEQHKLSSFKKLKQLTMKKTSIQTHHLENLIRDLPNLTKIIAKYEGIMTIDGIKLFIGATKNHSSLRTIQLNTGEMDNISIHSLSLNFHEWWNAHAKPDLKLRFGSIVITREKITKNGKLIHWYPFYLHGDQCGKMLIELKDNCLRKIIEYLDFGGKLALSQTCHRMQKIIEPIFKYECSKDDFQIPSDMFLTENFLQHFSHILPRIYLYSYRVKVTIWNLIHQFCSNYLEELIIEGASYSFVHYLHAHGIIFPKLKTLKLKRFNSSYYDRNQTNNRAGELFNFCPNLLNLEIDKTNGFASMNMSTFENVLMHLSVLRFESCDNLLVDFLRGLNDSTCDNIRDLSIRDVKSKVDSIGYDSEDEDSEDYDRDMDGKVDANILMNTITRFTQLTSLHLIINGWFEMNPKFLFQSCLSVKVLSVFYDADDNAKVDTFKQIKNYGAKIEKLQIAMRAEDKDWKCYKFLKSINQIFPNITVKIIEYYKSFENPANSFILSSESLSNWGFNAQLFR